MLAFRTQGYNGYAVKYSPYFDNKLAVASSANFGLVGNGRLYVLSIQPNGAITNDLYFDTQDGLFDLSWSEMHENHIVTANGDGSLKLFDITVGKFPIMQWKEHQREVFSTSWNLVDKSSFTSSSWDGTVKLWTPSRKQSLLTLSTVSSENKNNCCYQASFSPHDPNLIASANANGHVQIWDTRSSKPMVADVIGHGGMEVLTLDWNKYQQGVLATGGVDKQARVWDIRSMKPLTQFIGHDFAVRKVVWNPHNGSELLTCSYDMTARIWNMNGPKRFNNHSTNRIFNRHKEFVIGGDYSLWGDPGWVCTTGWDEMVYVWDSKRI